MCVGYSENRSFFVSVGAGPGPGWAGPGWAGPRFSAELYFSVSREFFYKNIHTQIASCTQHPRTKREARGLAFIFPSMPSPLLLL